MPLPERIRSFIAVQIPPALRERLHEVQGELRSRLRQVAWTRPDACHLTLLFLGEIETRFLPELSQRLEEAAASTPAFDLELAELGCFGQRVIWVGLGHGSDQLMRVAERVRHTAREFSRQLETKPFQGHVTLGRSRGREPIASILASRRNTRLGSWRVEEIELIRSELLPQGARYTTLEQFALVRGTI